MDGIFLQQMINGLTLGSVYGLIAIGYTMVYGIIGMINFAHGEVYMVSAYLSAIGLALLAFFGLHSFPLLILGTLIFTILVTGVYGWVIERIAYKPLRNSTRLAPLISAIGMSLILQNYVQLLQGAQVKSLPPVVTGGFRLMETGGFAVQLSYLQIIIVLVTETSLITPPIGVNLFVIQSIRGRGPINDVIIGSLPFVGTMFVMIAAIFLFPAMAMWLPTVFYR